MEVDEDTESFELKETPLLQRETFKPLVNKRLNETSPTQAESDTQP